MMAAIVTHGPALLGRMLVVALGLVPFALGVVLTLRSALGLGPWLVLNYGHPATIARTD